MNGLNSFFGKIMSFGLTIGILFIFSGYKIPQIKRREKVSLTLVFDSSFHSRLFAISNFTLCGRNISSDTKSDTFKKKIIFNLQDLKTGECTLKIPTEFCEPQKVLLRIISDSVVFVRNNWAFVDSVSLSEFLSSDSVEFIYRNQVCRTELAEDKYLLIKSVAGYRLIEMNVKEHPRLPEIGDFNKTVYKSEDDKYKVVKNHEKLVSFDIVKDLFLIQKGIRQSFKEGESRRLRSSSSNSQFYIKVGNKIVAFEQFYVTDWSYYNGFERKYLK